MTRRELGSCCGSEAALEVEGEGLPPGVAGICSDLWLTGKPVGSLPRSVTALVAEARILGDPATDALVLFPAAALEEVLIR